MSEKFDITVRRPDESEMDQIYLAGFDVWADKICKDEYLQDCRTSGKYQKGEWWIADRDGRMVSSMIVYRDVFGLPPGSLGLGSVATPPESRRRGNASQLIKTYLDMRQNESVLAVFLFAEVKPEIYERLGFVVLPTELQKYAGSFCMVKCDQETLDAIKAGRIQAPRYF